MCFFCISHVHSFVAIFPTLSKAVEKGPEKLKVGAWKPTLYNVTFSNGEWAEGMAHWIKCSLTMQATGGELFSRTQVKSTASIMLPCNPTLKRERLEASWLARLANQ